MRITDLTLNTSLLVEKISKYEKAIDQIETLITIEGKTIAEACKEQPKLLYKYLNLLAECDGIVKFIDGEMLKTRGAIFRRYQDNSSKIIPDRTIERYVDCEQAYLDQYHLLIEVKSVRDKLSAVVEAVKSRGWILKQLVDLRINGLEHGVL